MNLWIRSQDREDLIKAKRLGIQDVIGNGTYYILDREYDYPLATYKTKERALEVLDEIHKLLMPQVKIIHNKTEQEKLQDFSSNIIIQPMIEDIQIQQASSYVYQMPEE